MDGEEGERFEEEVKEELDAVESVFAEELQDVVHEPEQWLRISIRPDTAGEELQVFCSLSLKISLPAGYPRKHAAEFHLENLVGLSDEDSREMQEELLRVSNEMKEDQCPALFNLIQTAKDFVNTRNTPSDDCCICLCPFEGDEEFFKTPCAHCFHAECLARWTHDQHVQARAKQARQGKKEEEEEKDETRCPICRGSLGQELVKLLSRWTEPLASEHARACQQEAEEAERQRKVKQKETAAKQWEERRRKEEEEREAFQPQPILVIGYFEGGVKILRHVMGPLGATDCRIVGVGAKSGAKSGGGGEGATAASWGVVWFPNMDKALRAHRSLEKSYAVRVASYDDLKHVR